MLDRFPTPGTARLCAWVLALGSIIYGAEAQAGIVGAARDALTTPGKTVRLEAWFARNYGRFVRPGLADVEVEFKLLPELSPPPEKDSEARAETGELIGQVRTDSRGYARIDFTPKSVGNFRYSVALTHPTSRKEVLTLHGLIRVIPPERRLIVFDIDRTLSDMREVLVPLAGDQAEAYAGAPELLRRLSASYEIVYLSARDELFRGATLSFLRHHSFPRGALYFNDLRADDPEIGNQILPSNHGKFKAKVLKAMLERGLSVLACVGNAKTDAEAYESIKRPAFLLREDDPRAERFDDYKALEERFKALGWLP